MVVLGPMSAGPENKWSTRNFLRGLAAASSGLATNVVPLDWPSAIDIDFDSRDCAPMAQSQSSAPLTVRELAPQETAMLVLRYLQENNFEQASRAFAVEADSLLKLVQRAIAESKG